MCDALLICGVVCAILGLLVFVHNWEQNTATHGVWGACFIWGNLCPACDASTPLHKRVTFEHVIVALLSSGSVLLWQYATCVYITSAEERVYELTNSSYAALAPPAA